MLAAMFAASLTTGVMAPTFGDDVEPAADGTFRPFLQKRVEKAWKEVLGRPEVTQYVSTYVLGNDYAKVFNEFKLEGMAHEGGEGMTKGAIVFYSDHYAIANGDGKTVTAPTADGKANPAAPIGNPIGWVGVEELKKLAPAYVPPNPQKPGDMFNEQNGEADASHDFTPGASGAPASAAPAASGGQQASPLGQLANLFLGNNGSGAAGSAAPSFSPASGSGVSGGSGGSSPTSGLVPANTSSAPTQGYSPSGDQGTAAPGQKSRAGFIQLPASGDGFYGYTDAKGRWGTEKMIYGIERIGRAWASSKPASCPGRLGVGDISLENGGPFAGHASHQKGVDCDMALPRNDGKESPRVDRFASAYSREGTQAAINTFRKELPVTMIFFNDPGVTGRQNWPNHDNHFHVRISN